MRLSQRNYIFTVFLLNSTPQVNAQNHPEKWKWMDKNILWRGNIDLREQMQSW